MSSNNTFLTAAIVVGFTTGYMFAVQKAASNKDKKPKGTSTGSLPKSGERKYLIGGNWKCNGTIECAQSIVKTLNECGPIPQNCEVVVAAPFLHLTTVMSAIRDDVEVAAQNCGVNDKFGAYTGEVAVQHLVDAGVTWVLVGHSERREGFGMVGESNDLCAKKLKVAIDGGLKVMFCIGEKKEEREKGVTLDVCAAQLKPAADVLTVADWENVAIAYEPVWAIGTGLTATPEMAQDTHAGIRKWVADNISPEVAKSVRIQYGGSMKGSNAKELLAQPDIDGGLVGGASLKPDFVNIINAVPQP